ncbi:MAG: diguanylate cyclase [Pseudomonas sp.]|nr:diguanylate cyclase [Pseudomonas sp.]
MNSNDKNVIRFLFDDYLRIYASGDCYCIENFSEDFSGFSSSNDLLAKNREEWLAVPRQYFAQTQEPLRIELKDFVIRSLTETVAVTTSLLTIYRQTKEDSPSPETIRLVLIFRHEPSGWKITHSSISTPYKPAKDCVVDSQGALTQNTQILEEKIAEQANQLLDVNHRLAQALVEHQETDDELRNSEAMFRMMTENAVDVIWRLNDEYRFTYISPSDEKRRGYRADEVIGHSVFEMFDEEGISAILKAGQKRHEAEQQGIPLTDVTFEARHRCKDGTWIWGEVCYNPEFNAEGKVIGFYGISREITERKQMQEQVHQLAFYDPLTQLPNRHMLHERLSHAMAANKRTQCYGALMFLDLDNFKPINDSHGHIAGDLLLIEVAHRLKQCVREIDTVARFGGDEFIVVLSKLSTDEALSHKEAHAVAERIRIALAAVYQLTLNHDGKPNTCIEHFCTASIGVVLFRGQEVGIDDLFKQADSCMYRAKDGGRNAISFYNPADKINLDGSE